MTDEIDIARHDRSYELSRSTSMRHSSIESRSYKVASGTDFQSSERFAVNAVRIDNFTNQWLRLQCGIITEVIAPYLRNVKVNTWGLGSVSIVAVSGIPDYLPQYTNPSVIGTEQYIVTLFAERWPVEDGGVKSFDRVITLAEAAAVALPYTYVPINTVEVVSIGLLITTSAVIGVRQIRLRAFSPAGNQFWRAHAGATQAATLFRFYNFGQGVPREGAFIGAGATAATAPDIMIPLPDDFELQPQDTLQIQEENSVDAAGDSATINIHGRTRLSLV